MTAGIIAGSVAAVAASLLSLPLRSPDDILLNSGSVTVGSLVAGVAGGVLWRLAAGSRRRVLVFAALWAAGFAAVVAVSVIGETWLDHLARFALPLAAVVFALIGVLTPVLDRTPIARSWLVLAGAVGVALAVGIGLAGQGDQESGRLELPPRVGAASDAGKGVSLV